MKDDDPSIQKQPTISPEDYKAHVDGSDVRANAVLLAGNDGLLSTREEFICHTRHAAMHAAARGLESCLSKTHIDEAGRIIEHWLKAVQQIVDWTGESK